MKRLKFSVLVHTPITFEPYDVPQGVSIAEEDTEIYFDAEGLSLLTLAIEIGRDVASTIVAAWLYDRFVKRKASKPAKETKINERVITIGSREEFMQLVERQINESEEE